MNRVLTFLTVFAALLFTAPSAMAQMVYLHGGAGFPSSTAVNQFYNTGFNFGAGVGIPIRSHLEKLFGGLSMACDFADRVQPTNYSVTAFPAQNGFCTRPAPKAFECRAHLGPVHARRPLCLG